MCACMSCASVSGRSVDQCTLPFVSYDNGQAGAAAGAAPVEASSRSSRSSRAWVLTPATWNGCCRSWRRPRWGWAARHFTRAGPPGRCGWTTRVRCVRSGLWIMGCECGLWVVCVYAPVCRCRRMFVCTRVLVSSYVCLHACTHRCTLAGPAAKPASPLTSPVSVVQPPLLPHSQHLITNAIVTTNTGWEVPPEEWLNQEHERPMGPPPTSRRAVARLPEVVLTEADLAVDTNEECTCC